MMSSPIDKPKSLFGRRTFLKSAALTGAASGLGNTASAAPSNPPENSGHETSKKAEPPTAEQFDLEASTPEQLAKSNAEQSAVSTGPGQSTVFGSDFMIDVMKSLGLEYVFSNPGSSFLGLHESITVYGNNEKPEFITCMHEESAAAMCNGYYKAALKPAAMMCHGTVGLQHAAMNIYNAWCDRVPMIGILGNHADAHARLGATTWRHSAQDPASMVRDFTKWDDQPHSLQAFANSFVRGWKIATTPPMEPVVIVADAELQLMDVEDRSTLQIPRFTQSEPPQGERGAIREAAKMLVDADTPLIIADRAARTPNGMKLLVELAESLNAPVIDIASRQNIPTAHYLNHTRRSSQLIGGADVILGLEVTDFWGQVNFVNRETMTSYPRTKDGAKMITIDVNDLYLKSNYQDFQRYAPVDLSISGDAEATLPALIEEVKDATSRDRRRAIAEREKDMRTIHRGLYEDSRQLAAQGWNSSPVSTGRMCMELYDKIKGEDWALVSVGASERFVSSWPHRLWNIDEHYRYLG
ncbi:MAG: thiamine pyrophosphate-binding protein, partial [Rhodospirillaceae bacterium]